MIDEKSMIGYKSGKLEVIKFSHIKGRARYWLCRCECGREYPIYEQSLKTNKNYKVTQCKFCNRTTRESIQYKKFGSWTPIKKIEGWGKTRWICKCDCGFTSEHRQSDVLANKSQQCKKCCSKKNYIHNMGKYFYERIKEGAIKRNLEINITQEDIANLFIQQEEKCSLTGIPLNFATDYYDWKHGGANASLDRTDNSIGYTLNNVTWVHKDINKMKHAFPLNYFISICCLVADNYKNNKKEYNNDWKYWRNL